MNLAQVARFQAGSRLAFWSSLPATCLGPSRADEVGHEQDRAHGLAESVTAHGGLSLIRVHSNQEASQPHLTRNMSSRCCIGGEGGRSECICRRNHETSGPPASDRTGVHGWAKLDCKVGRGPPNSFTRRPRGNVKHVLCLSTP